MLEILSNQEGNGNELPVSLDEILQQGARKLLIHALNQEVEDYIEQNKSFRDENGHRLVVRNGTSQQRKIVTSNGTISLETPRVNDKRDDKKFDSKILPPYLRKSPKTESILPILYLKGLSGNSFKEALKDLLGNGANGLSPSAIYALKKSWEKDLKEWNSRPITKRYAYLWVDGVNVKVRLGEDKKVCLLVVIGVNEDGEKDLLSVSSGFRESEIGWKEVFNDLVRRGLKKPLLMIADGALGLWSAIKQLEEFKDIKTQRCWVHKIANVLDELPKKIQVKAKDLLHEMMKAEKKKDAEEALQKFKDCFESKYPKSVLTLEKNWDMMTTFFDFPAEHWVSIRTTNPIESAFATVKLRTKSMKGAGSCKPAETMAFKLLREAEKKWRPIRGWREVKKLLNGSLYNDGELMHNSLKNQVVA